MGTDATVLLVQNVFEGFRLSVLDSVASSAVFFLVCCGNAFTAREP